MNASLITSVADYLTIAAHQSYGNYGNMTVLLFNATLGAIVLDPSLTNVSVLGPAIGDLFGDDVFSIPQACAYPISGMKMNHVECYLTHPLISSCRSIWLPQSFTLLLLDTFCRPCRV